MSTFEQWNPQPVLLLVGLVAGERRTDVAGEVVVQIWKGGKEKKSLLQVFVVRMGKSKFAAAPVFLLFFRGCSRFLRQLTARVLGDYFSFPPNFRLGEKKEKKNIGLKSRVMRFSPSRIFLGGSHGLCSSKTFAPPSSPRFENSSTNSASPIRPSLSLLLSCFA